eukprot:scaffold2558_cov72-Skeletonema_dohrnii-CCMP3373.AAC.2
MGAGRGKWELDNLEPKCVSFVDNFSFFGPAVPLAPSFSPGPPATDRSPRTCCPYRRSHLEWV